MSTLDKRIEEVLIKLRSGLNTEIDKDITEATQTLKELIVEARLNERKDIALDNYYGHTFSNSTDWKAKFDKFIRNNEFRIKELQSKKIKE